MISVEKYVFSKFTRFERYIKNYAVLVTVGVFFAMLVITIIVAKTHGDVNFMIPAFSISFVTFLVSLIHSIVLRNYLNRRIQKYRMEYYNEYLKKNK